MKKALGALLLIALSVPIVLAEDPCKNCDCTVYPVKERCEKCCGVAKGTIKDFTKGKVTVSLPEGKEDTFGITEKTKIEGTPRKGDVVLIVYSTRDKAAGLIRISPPPLPQVP